MYYGVISIDYLRSIAVAVASCIGNGVHGNAALMCMETAAAETRCGQYRDPTPDGAGRGVGQTDEGTFDWLKKKYQTSAIADAIERDFGIRLSRVNHDDLDYNPLLSMIFVRLRYWVVDEPIPRTLAERAAYWKLHYNSSEGKGNEEHYTKQVKHCFGGGVAFR